MGVRCGCAMKRVATIWQMFHFADAALSSILDIRSIYRCHAIGLVVSSVYAVRLWMYGIIHCLADMLMMHALAIVTARINNNGH